MQAEVKDFDLLSRGSVDRDDRGAWPVMCRVAHGVCQTVMASWGECHALETERTCDFEGATGRASAL